MCGLKSEEKKWKIDVVGNKREVAGSASLKKLQVVSVWQNPGKFLSQARLQL